MLNLLVRNVNYTNLLQEREELQRKGAEMQRRLQNASVEVQGLQASLKDVSLSNSRLRSRLQQETGALGSLREQRAEKEGALFLRNHMVFTQQQQICVLKEAIEKEERCLEQTRQKHQCILDRLKVSQKLPSSRRRLPPVEVQKAPGGCFEEAVGTINFRRGSPVRRGRVLKLSHRRCNYITHCQLLLQDIDEKRRNVEKESDYIDEKLQRSMKQRLKLQTSIQKRRRVAAPSSQPVEVNDECQFCNAEIQCHAECLKGMLQSLYRSMG